MDVVDTSLPEVSQLIEQRFALLRTLADSLELSSPALAQNDAQAITRGAAHQVELCRRWSSLEEQLRRQTRQSCAAEYAGGSGNSPEEERALRLQAEWEKLSARIRYLTRVHCSLLRHLQRTLAVLNRVVGSCAHTYTPESIWLKTEVRTGVPRESMLRAGE
jgi:hypothetical protein